MAVPFCLASFVVLLAAIPASAQDGSKLTLATVLARGRSLGQPLPRTAWLPGGHDATVVRTAADGNETLHRLAAGAVADDVLVDARAVRKALEQPGDGPAQFPAMAWSDATTLRLETALGVARWQPGQEKATWTLRWDAPDTADAAQPGPRHAVAPDDRHVALVRDHQLWLVDASGGKRQLTFDGSPDVVYAAVAHRAEFGIDRGLFWSGDGRFLAFYREDLRPIAPYPYQDLGHVPAKPVAGRYPMAGQRHSRVQIGVCDTRDFAIRWLDQDPDADVYLTNVTFGPGTTVHVARVDRGQTQLELVRHDATTGKVVATLLRENDPQWVEPEHGPTFLGDGRFLWWSSKDGHRHLWLHDADGAPLTQVTKGTFDVQALVGLAADGKGVWFEAADEDPRQRHLWFANFDGSEVRKVTRERGTHRATLSPDGTFAHVVWSNLETPPQARLVELANGTATPLPSGPDPLAGTALPQQRMFTIKTDGDVVLFGPVALPPDLAAGQRCPVLLYVYGGPHVQQVTDQWLGGAPLWLQALAAEGYVVCRLDNRGTPNRGIEFEQSVHRQLGVLEVQDQLKAVEWCKQQPFVDPARIGVHGWSYGGYMTLRLLLAAPTTFACGVSGAPVTDWTMYETGYGERYMDTPAENPEGYKLSSCLPFVGRLERPLLLVHPTDDRTVVWQHTLAFVDRCIAEQKVIDYFPYPGQRHGLVGAHRAHFLGMLHGWLGKHLRPAERLVEKPAEKVGEKPVEAPKEVGK
ncbi:MAG: DPP IV N-terminal domain-containing protein [Planctomycetes bacterium]|nr:DPP IV N-terminal domain-containing protein [Planctomycetota bacterium]